MFLTWYIVCFHKREAAPCKIRAPGCSVHQNENVRETRFTLWSLCGASRRQVLWLMLNIHLHNDMFFVRELECRLPPVIFMLYIICSRCSRVLGSFQMGFLVCAECVSRTFFPIFIIHFTGLAQFLVAFFSFFASHQAAMNLAAAPRSMRCYMNELHNKIWIYDDYSMTNCIWLTRLPEEAFWNDSVNLREWLMLSLSHTLYGGD